VIKAPGACYNPEYCTSALTLGLKQQSVSEIPCDVRPTPFSRLQINDSLVATATSPSRHPKLALGFKTQRGHVRKCQPCLAQPDWNYTHSMPYTLKATGPIEFPVLLLSPDRYLLITRVN